MKKTKKYELVAEDTIKVLGATLFRIRALTTLALITGGVVEKGDLGGYIEKKRKFKSLW